MVAAAAVAAAAAAVVIAVASSGDEWSASENDSMEDEGENGSDGSYYDDSD